MSPLGRGLLITVLTVPFTFLPSVHASYLFWPGSMEQELVPMNPGQEERFQLDIERLEETFHQNPSVSQEEIICNMNRLQQELAIYQIRQASREMFEAAGYDPEATRPDYTFLHHPGFEPAGGSQHDFGQGTPRQVPKQKDSTDSTAQGRVSDARRPGAKGFQHSRTAETGAGQKESENGDGAPPLPPFDPTTLLDNPRKFTVSRTVTVRGQEYSYTTTLTGLNLELFCGICRDLTESQAVCCNYCHKLFCHSHLRSLGVDPVLPAGQCPFCRGATVFSGRDLADDINSLLWRCGQLCGTEVETTHLESHIDECQKLEFLCEHEGCRFEGNYHEVTQHEAQCLFRLEICPYAGCSEEYQRQQMPYHQESCAARPFLLGPVIIPAAVFRVLCRFRQGTANPVIAEVFDNPDADEAETARYAVNFLTTRLESINPEKVICSLCVQPVCACLLELHLDECRRQIQKCSYCSTSVPREKMAEHLSLECEKNMISCELCRAEVIQKDQGFHQTSGECPNKQCSLCEAIMTTGNYPTHRQYCRTVMPYFGRDMKRYQGNTEFPVYHSDDRHTLIMFLPVLSFWPGECSGTFCMEYAPKEGIVLSIVVRNDQHNDRSWVGIHGKVDGVGLEELGEQKLVHYVCECCIDTMNLPLIKYRQMAINDWPFQFFGDRSNLVPAQGMVAMYISISNPQCVHFSW